MRKNKKLKRILSSERGRNFGIYSTSVGASLGVLSFCLFIEMPSFILGIYVLLGVLLFFKPCEVRYTFRECAEYRKLLARILLVSVLGILAYTPLAIIFLPLLSVYLTKKMINFYNEVVAIEEFKLLHKKSGESITEEERTAILALCRKNRNC